MRVLELQADLRHPDGISRRHYARHNKVCRDALAPIEGRVEENAVPLLQRLQPFPLALPIPVSELAKVWVLVAWQPDVGY